MLGKIRAGREGGDRGQDGWMGHKFEQTPGNSEGQGSLAFCSPWSHKELDMT